MKGLLKRISCTALLALLLPLSGAAQVTAAFPSRVATDQDTLLAANKAQSNLVQPLTSSATNFQLISASNFKAPGVVTIDNEIIWFCSVFGNLLYVCPGGRGFDNTFPSFHAAGSQVSGLMTAYHHNRLASEIKALEGALGAGMANVMPASRQFNFSELLGKATAQQLALFDANLALNAPGAVNLHASTTAAPSLVIPPGIAPTAPTTGALWNANGTLSYFDGTASHALVAANPDGSVTTTGQTLLANAFRFYNGNNDGNTSYGDFRTNLGTGNTIISAKSAALYFNYDHGTGGVIFGNGAGGNVGSVDAAGNAAFLGTTHAFGGKITLGSGTPMTPAAAGIQFGSDVVANVYRSAAGVVKTDGAFQGAHKSSAGTSGLTGNTCSNWADGLCTTAGQMSQYSYSGTADSAGAILTSKTGQDFSVLFIGMGILINGSTWYTITAKADSTHVTLNSSPGTLMGATWAVTGVSATNDLGVYGTLRINGGNMYMNGAGLMAGGSAVVNSGGQFGWVQPYGVDFQLGSTTLTWGTLFINNINWVDHANWGTGAGNSLGGMNSTGTLTVFNQKTTTGSSNVTIQAGAGQSTNDLFNIKANGGGTLFSISSGGIATVNGGLGLSGVFSWAGSSALQAPANGKIMVSNYSGTDFTSLQLGGATNAFPSIKRNGTALNFRLADDSADAPITAGAASHSAAVSVGIPGAANGARTLAFAAYLGTDASLHDLDLLIGGFPSATAASRYTYIQAQDFGNYRPFVLQPDGGYVGIGKTNPGVALDVTGTVQASVNFYSKQFNGDTGTTFQNGTSGDLNITNAITGNIRFLTGGTAGANERMRIDGSGNVGIGTTTSADVLSLQRTASDVFVSLWDNSVFKGGFGYVATANHWISGSVTNDVAVVAQSNLLFSAGGNTERMRILSGGNVGLSNASPNTLLNIGGGTPTTASSGIQFGTDATANLYRSAAGVVKSDGTLSAPNFMVPYAGGLKTNGGTTYTNMITSGWDGTADFLGLSVPTNGASGASPIVTLRSTGNVGVGTIAPAVKLHVAAMVSTPALGTAAGTLALTGADNLYGLYYGVYGTGSSWLQAQRQDGNTAAYNILLNPLGGSVAIATTSTPGRLTIGSTGGSDASLGAELTTGTWTSTGWTGSAVPFTHTPGNTSALSLTIPSLAANNYYQVFVQTSSRTAGTIATTLGGVVIDPGTYYLTGGSGWTHGIKAATTGALIIMPTTDFDGAVTVSVKLVTPVTGYALAMLDSAGNISSTFSQRSNGSKSSFIGGGGQYEVYGYNSMAIGLNALQYNVTGINNTAIGALTLQNNLSGDANTAIGMNTLVSNINGGGNTGIGSYVLTANTSGGNNTAIGVQALQGNTTGNSNTGIGVYALQANTTGTMNAAVGMGSLFANTTAQSNTAVGFYALSAVQTASSNTGIGDHAMYQTTSYQNVAIGTFSLGANVGGNNNTALGYLAGGWNSGNPNISGSNNTWIGAGTLPAGSSGGTQYNYQTVIGAGATGACSNCVVLGRSSDALVAPGAISTPASSSASCSAGQVAFDSSYAYFCTAANTWKRAAIATW